MRTPERTSTGPRTRDEALKKVAGATAAWLDSSAVEDLFSGLVLTGPQERRLLEAMNEIAARLRAMGSRKTPEGGD